MSSSSSASSSSPAPTRKRKQSMVGSLDSSDEPESDASSTDEEESDKALPPPPSLEDVVLSHAERRRQKKKQKREQFAAASESQSPRKKPKLDGSTGPAPPSPIHAEAKAKANVSAKPPKHQNSVWVGNLSFWTTQESLREFFDGVGTITRVHMPMRRGQQVQGENMGFAYVDFETPEAKVIAITLSEGRLDGRNLLIKDGEDFSGRPTKVKTESTEGEGEKPSKNATTVDKKCFSKTAQKILRVQKQAPAPTLFLGNLGFETTDESIRELFEAHRYWGHKTNTNEGEGTDAAKSEDVWIRKIRMGTFEDSGACKGFAFIDFTSIEHATEALINPRNHRLNGRALVVEYASPDAVRRGGGGHRNSKGDWDRKGKGGSGKMPQRRSNTKQGQPRHVEQEEGTNLEEISAEVTTTPPSKSQRPERTGQHRLYTRRAKPGAALAHAQRQSAAILPAQGQKVVF